MDTPKITTIQSAEELFDLEKKGRLNGFYNIMNDRDYHMGPGLSQSILKKILKSPAHCKAAMESQDEPTAAMRFGSAVHCKLLEPHKFSQRYVVDNVNGSTKEGKLTLASYKGQGLIRLKSDEMLEITAMERVWNDSLAKKIADQSVKELAMYWYWNGILCRAKPDLLDFEKEATCDLKTTPDARGQEFAKSVANFGYHFQDAFYRQGLRALTGKRFLSNWIAIEKTRPYGLIIHSPDEPTKEEGEKLVSEAFCDYYSIVKGDGVWPGYPDDIQTLSLPTWGYSR